MTRSELLRAEEARVLKLYNSSKHKAGFINKKNFANWFLGRLEKQNFCCFYCETSIIDIKELISKKLLKTRKTGYGFRGPVLEIDKMVNDMGYNPQNCVLSCYYCNNDKSYILHSSVYKIHFGANRKRYFDSLLSS
jgi:hypothetical protein